MHFSDDTGSELHLAIIGSGRLGNALACALDQIPTLAVVGPLERGADPRGLDAVLLCVPDAEIAAAAAAITPGPLVGHCSGASDLNVLAPHEAFSLHPLMTVPANARPSVLTDAGAALAGSTPRATAVARALAELLLMRPFEIDDADRAAYHAAASIASNFLVTLEGAAERLAASVGVGRDELAPLVRATVENWARLGSERALTGPVARGDEVTVQRQRAAVVERAPELADLFDALVAATQALARTEAVVS